MKDLSKDNLMDFHTVNDGSKLEKIQNKVYQSLFSLLFVLLKNQEVNIWFETICLLFQLFQLIAFSFNPIFTSIWKKDTLFVEISNILQYFQFTLFFQDNKEMYLIAFYLCILLVIFLYIDVTYVSFSFSSNRLNIMWPLRFLQSFLYLIINAFYLPIFSIFLSMFSCTSTEDGNNLFVKSIKCWTKEFYIHGIFALIFSFLFFCFCFFFQITYFETKFGSSNPISKSTSRPDLVFFCVKSIIMLIFTFLPSANNQWSISAIMVLLSGYCSYIYYDVKPYYNVLISKNYLGTCIIFFWANIVLLIGKILELTDFDGAIPLFFLGVPVIIITLAFQNEDIIKNLLTNISKFTKAEKALLQIRDFFILISQKDNSRNAKIKLKGYIIQFEEECNLSDCPLKKYISSIQTPNVDGLIFLLQHGEMMYQNAMIKFPQSDAIRISYACFLLEQMNKKRQAALELSNAEKQSPKLEEQFIIFRYNKLLEENSTEISENEDNLDIVSNLAYKNHMTLFKSSINKVSVLYIDFWSLLLNPNQDSHEDLTKLNDYGTKINTLVEEINTHFNKMQKLKLNDQEAIKYYADFLNDILNDKEKALEYKSKINEIEDTKETIDDNNLATADLNAIYTNDEYQYIIASAQIDKFGVITNISLGICGIFGYTKHELIGKVIEVIMPDIYHKGHREVLNEKINEFKKKSIALNELQNYKPTYVELSTFGKNKSRYLVPLTFKTALIPTENNDIIFIAKIWQEQAVTPILSTHQSIVIMTNNYFTIQNFTANAVNSFGLTSSAINNNIEVTDFIKQFHEDFLRFAVENEDKTPEQKLLIKKNIINKKYKTGTFINWKRNEIMDLKAKTSKLVEFHTSIGNDTINDNSFTSNNRMINKMTGFDDTYMLTVTDVIVHGKQEGYLFKFEPSTCPLTTPKKNKINCTTSGHSISGEYKKTKSSKNNNQTQPHPQDNSEDNNQSKLKVEASYIPDNNRNNFQLDPKALAFKQNLPNTINVKDYLKKEAIKKIESQTLKTKKTDSEGDEEYTSSYESGDYSSSKDDTSNISHEDATKNIVTIKKSEDEYYKVNVQQIKYSIYDYTKGMLVEIKNFDRIDQVQRKISDDHDKDDDSPEKKNENTPNAAVDIAQNPIEGGGEPKSKENVLIKQIEYALGKEESQPTITKMRWICFVVFLVFLGFGGGVMAIIILYLDTLKENMSLIEKAFELLILNSVGIYYCRELTLLRIENYTSLPAERETYLNNTFNSTLEVFINSHTLITYIITTFLSISQENNLKLFNSTLMSTIIEDDYSLSQFKLSYTSAFIEANTALFHTGHSELGNIISTNKDVFFYLYNSLNEIEIAFGIQGNTLINELKMNTDKISMHCFIVLSVIIALIFVIYFLLSYGYNGIAKRKESYLEVFFEIGSGVIKTSLEKCENFTKKMQTESINDGVSTSDDNDLEKDPLILSNNNDKREQRSRKGNNASRESKIIKMKFGLMLLLIGLFVILTFTFYLLYLGNIESFMEYYKNIEELNNDYLMLFNGLREFMFDKNSDVMRNDSLIYINNALEDFYVMKQIRTKSLDKNINKIPKVYVKEYMKIYKESACTLNIYFPSVSDCEVFMSNSTNYGLEIVLNYFIEEIRTAKNNAEQYQINQTKTNEIFNLTLTGTELWESYWPVDSERLEIYKSYDSINLFNTENLHLKLNIMFIYIIYPNFNHLSNILKQTFDSSFKNIKLVYIILISIYLGLIFAGYVFVWLPYETKMNQTIYKTKNMLSIIPKEVLASLSNIHKLLNLNQNSNSKGQIRNTR